MGIGDSVVFWRSWSAVSARTPLFSADLFRLTGLASFVDLRDVRAMFLVAVAYYIGAKVGFAFTFDPLPISVLWLPNSLLLAALLLTPTGFWWKLILAVLPAHLAAELPSGVPIAMVFGWFVSNCSEALLGAFCIRRFASAPLRFDSFHDVIVFVLFGVMLAPLLSSFFDAMLVTSIGWGQGDYLQLVSTRFFSNMLAVLMVVPVVLTWASIRLVPMDRTMLWRGAEAGLLLLGLIVIGVTVFQGKGWFANPAFFYAPLPFLLWAAVRFGPTGISAYLVVFGLFAIWGATHGKGPFLSGFPENDVRSVQLFLIFMSIPLLMLTAVVGERRKVEKTLKRSEERAAKIFHSSASPMVIVRLSDGVCSGVNARWEELFGYSRAEVNGHSFLEFNPFINRRDRRALLNQIATEGYVQDFEIDLRDRGGHTHRVSVTAQTIELDDELCGMFSVRDVTEQRNSERDALEQRRQLMHLSRVVMLSELSGALAHELNQPLSAILSNAQAAQRFLSKQQIDVGELREILADIVSEDQRAGEVIRRLRALFKQGETNFQALDLNELVSDVLNLARGDFILRDIDVVTDIASPLPLVFGDRVELQQVLLNLIVNACEAMTDKASTGRTLSIGADISSGHAIRLYVRDQGPGIPIEKLERLFEPFFTTKPQGLGLGLSISRTIISAHGGQLWGVNNPDGGACFQIILPTWRSQ